MSKKPPTNPIGLPDHLNPNPPTGQRVKGRLTNSAQGTAQGSVIPGAQSTDNTLSGTPEGSARPRLTAENLEKVAKIAEEDLARAGAPRLATKKWEMVAGAAKSASTHRTTVQEVQSEASETPSVLSVTSEKSTRPGKK
jgi:hypothetical protein